MHSYLPLSHQSPVALHSILAFLPLSSTLQSTRHGPFCRIRLDQSVLNSALPIESIRGAAQGFTRVLVSFLHRASD